MSSGEIDFESALDWAVRMAVDPSNNHARAYLALTAQLREKTEENERTQTLRNLAEAWWVTHRAFEDSGGIGNAIADTQAQEALIKELTGSWLPFIVPEFAAELATARAEVKRLEDLVILYDDWLPGCEDDALVRAEASVIRARRLEKP